MNATLPAKKTGRLSLWADTAADLMMPNPVSVRADATVREALSLLLDRGYSAAPVIDEAGKPVGVLSRSDLLVHDREAPRHLAPVPEYYRHTALTLDSGERLTSGFQIEEVDQTQVRDMMTPAIFSVPPDAPAATVIEEMLALNVHRLFVVDASNVLVGVITTFDILRHLRS